MRLLVAVFTTLALLVPGPGVAVQDRSAEHACPTLLVAGPVLEGTVKGPNGEWIEGALVAARSSTVLAAEPVRTARTDAAGGFRLPLAGSAPFTIRVEAKGFAARTLEEVHAGRPLAVRLATGGVIEGTVREASGGAPVAGARVEARSRRMTLPLLWEPEAGVVATTTDAKGNFRLAGCSPGPHVLSATAKGLGRAERAGIRAGARADLVLLPGASISGTVRDARGQAVPGAVVRIEHEENPWFLPRVTEADTDGRFAAIGLEPGLYTVIARRQDLAPTVVRDLVVRGEAEVDADLVLVPGAVATGRLIGPNRQSLAGRVNVEEVDGHPTPYSLSAILGTAAGIDGHFRLEHVPLGSHLLTASATGVLPARLEAEVGARSATVDVGDIVFERGQTIRGRVRNRGGNAVPGAHIRARQPESRSRSDVTTEADGSFVLVAAEPTTHQLYVTASGYAPSFLVVESGAKDLDIVLDLGGQIGGFVVDEVGRPVDAYRVSARREAPPGERTDSPRSKAVVAEDGRFDLEDLGAGNYVVRVEAAEHADAVVPDISVQSGLPTDVGRIRLRRGGTVRGVVVSSDDEPLAGATVIVTGAGENDTSATTDITGAFETRGVPPGLARVVAMHPDYAPGHVSGVDVDPARAAAETRVVLSEGGRIEGWARERDGTPIADVLIEVSLADRQLGGVETNVVPAAADGSFEVEHVPPGRAIVSLVSRSARRPVGSRQREVLVQQGQTARVEFLNRRILVGGRVTRFGAPAPQRRVRIGDGADYPPLPSRAGEAGTEPQPGVAVTRDDGSYELWVADAGATMLFVTETGREGPGVTRMIEIPDVDSFALDIPLDGVPLAGSVVDAATEHPVPRAHVSVMSSSGDNYASMTGADGRFHLEADPGEASVSVSAWGYLNDTLPVTVGPAGVADLRVPLERGKTLRGQVTDAGGRRLPGVNVFASTGDSEIRHMSAALTNPDGSFELLSLRNDPYDLVAGSPTVGYAVLTNVSPDNRNVALTLRPPGRGRLRVLSPDGGPASAAYAQMFSVDGAKVGVMEPSGPSDASGVLELTLPAGTVELIVGGPEGHCRASLIVPEGGTVEAEVKLEVSPGLQRVP